MDKIMLLSVLRKIFPGFAIFILFEFGDEQMEYDLRISFCSISAMRVILKRV